MKLSLKPTDPAKLDVDILILFAFEKQNISLSHFSAQLQTLVTGAVKKEVFEGKEGQTLIFSTKGYITPYKLLLIGVGKKESITCETIQTAVAMGVKKAMEFHLVNIAFLLPDFFMEKYAMSNLTASLVESIFLSSYRFTTYKSQEEKDKIHFPEDVIFIVPASKIRSGEEGIERGTLFAKATLFARDLVNEPAGVVTPLYLGKAASAIAKSSKGKIQVTLLGKEEIEKLGMHAFLGVARGSDEPPQFIRLHYRSSRPERKIVLIGKGITFDTGGLSLKPSQSMETMKTDMAGGASVLAVFSVLAQLLPRVEVIGLIAACENMPSGKALRPGDIVTAMNGKTIEVLNTDAEGRLTLADVLSYAIMKEKPDEIIDLATLTGACMVALGEDIAGLWGNNEILLSRIEKSAKATGEKIWRMPLEKGYIELLKSSIADIKNIQTGRYGGAVTAALFLSEFVGDVPWVHMDIAGPAFVEKDQPLAVCGGSGFGVRLLLDYLSS